MADTTVGRQHPKGRRVLSLMSHWEIAELESGPHRFQVRLGERGFFLPRQDGPVAFSDPTFKLHIDCKSHRMALCGEEVLCFVVRIWRQVVEEGTPRSVSLVAIFPLSTELEVGPFFIRVDSMIDIGDPIRWDGLLVQDLDYYGQLAASQHTDPALLEMQSKVTMYDRHCIELRERLKYHNRRHLLFTVIIYSIAILVFAALSFLIVVASMLNRRGA